MPECEQDYKTGRYLSVAHHLLSAVHRQKSQKRGQHFRSQSIPRNNMRVLSKVNIVMRVCTRNYGFTAIRRDYGPEAVEKLRGSVKIEQTLARRGAERLWELINRGEDSYVNALGAMTGKRKDL